MKLFLLLGLLIFDLESFELLERVYKLLNFNLYLNLAQDALDLNGNLDINFVLRTRSSSCCHTSTRIVWKGTTEFRYRYPVNSPFVRRIFQGVSFYIYRVTATDTELKTVPFYLRTPAPCTGQH